MRLRRILCGFVSLMGLMLGGCSGGGAPPAPAGQGATPAVVAADKGRILFLQCRACHSLGPLNEPGKIGPSLYGVIGRPAGAAADYAYSGALAKSGITWTPDQLDKWLELPSDFLPGNKMVFVGIPNPDDRASIIAYIEQESAKPSQQ